MQHIRRAWLMAILLVTSTIAHAVDGSYDPSWPGSGRIRLDVSSGSDAAEALFVQPDGKIVIAGTCEGDSYCAARLLPNGSYDAAFGNSGNPGRFVQGYAGTTLRLAAAAHIADGSIVLAGTSRTSGVASGLLAKLNPAGSQVTLADVRNVDFGGDYQLNAMAVQADGKIVVAGQASSTNGSHDIVVTRFRADLSRDTSFGDFGQGTKRVTYTNGSSAALAVAIQADGKIVVVGASVDDVAAARLLANGQLDDDPATGFGDGGRAMFVWGLFSRALAIAVDRDGSLLLAGAAYGNTGPDPSQDFFVNRLSSRGLQMPGFGLLCPPPFCDPGPAYFDWGNKDDLAYALTVQTDGKILVSGSSRSGANDLFAVVRFDSVGIPDNSFGVIGQTRSWYGASAGVDDAKAIAVGNAGIMIAGYSRGAGPVEARFGIAKLQLDLIFKGHFE